MLGRRGRIAQFRERSATGWRIRVGSYRVIYEIADSIGVVRVYRIRHRREAYSVIHYVYCRRNGADGGEAT